MMDWRWGVKKREFSTVTLRFLDCLGEYRSHLLRWERLEGGDWEGKRRILIFNAVFEVLVSYLRVCLKKTVEHISLEFRREG